MDTPFLKPLGLLFLLCTSDQQKNKLCKGPSNEHSNWPNCFTEEN